MNSKLLLVVFLLCFPLGAVQYDLIIKKGSVIDGSGKKTYPADIAVKGERIASIGDLRNAKASRVISAEGLIVSPGFIDMLGQSEDYLLIDPRAMSKVMMGVTTEITGEGTSIAPLNDRLIHEEADFCQRFHLTMDWRTFGEYFQRLEKQRMGVNLGTYVGATQLRKYVIGLDAREPTKTELEEMRRLLSAAMEQGTLGVSSALEYIPARFAKTEELIELAKVAHRYGGIYATHQRSEANQIDSSLSEVFMIAEQAKIPVEIFHLKVAGKKNWGKMPGVLKRIEEAHSKGLDVTADVYPYIAAGTGLTACLPPWALEGGVEKIIARLKDSSLRAKIKTEMMSGSGDWENIYLGSGGAEGILISAALDPKLEPYQGRRLSEIAKEQKKDPLDTLFDLIIADHGHMSAMYFMVSEEDMRSALKASFTTIGTDGGARAIDGPLSVARAHPRAWGTFARILGHYVREEKWLSLEQAIHKMTGQAASRVGLKDRGLLKKGYFADITVFDPKTVQDKATFEKPSQYAEGIRYVLINGQFTVDNGKRTDVLSGKVLRGPGYKGN